MIPASVVPSFIEHRRCQRMGTTYPALILAHAGAPLHPCTVLDVSSGGGRIRLDTVSPVPDHFVLFFTATGSVRRTCRVIWRRDDLIGVAFIGSHGPV